MNLATLVQSQTLATLLQALAPAAELTVGKTVEARLLALAGDGTATAQVGDTTISLVLAGPAAKQATLQPGATLLLRIDAAETAGAGLRATLVEVRPPAAPVAQPGAAPAADSAPQPVAPGKVAAAQPAPSQPVLLQQGAVAQTAAAAQIAGARQPGSAPAPLAPATAEADPPVSAQTATPRMLAGPLLGPALARQDSLAPLLANLRGLAEGSVSLVLPKPLLGAIDRVLAQTVPVERRPFTAQTLKNAVQDSGLFLEAREASGQPVPARSDLKAALLALRGTLASMVEALSPRLQGAANPVGAETQPQTAPDQQSRPAPPRRDGPLQPQPVAEPTLSAGEKPLAVARALLDQADAAIDRIKLAQYASLPPEGSRVETGQVQRWHAEIPLAFQQGAAVLPLQIEKEPPRRDADGSTPPLWRVRFALDVEPMGPLQGVVTLQGRSVGVTLWAEREETSRLLRSATPGLEEALADAEFENGTIDVHTGQPRTLQPTAGQFLDRLS